ncbi:unnamed protein product [Macrosiphum euphorbiae]|uniref:Uncharacterized protein n=1 Tax=Macrosiphum euphorbiae TaxID=13131 RepID=A0AAV0WVN9_9HEMI|nr:unnamed protein product [Macrosiphum euphorbiae]
MNTDLYPTAGKLLSFRKMFIIDQNKSTDIRCNMLSTLNREIINAIDGMLRQQNQFDQSLEMMHDEIRESMINNQMNTEPEMRLLF